jgi:uncharacterized protein (DUF433 family)
MKKATWLLASVIVFLGLVVYWGNVIVIGEYIGRLLGCPAAAPFTPKVLIVYAWNVLAAFAPFLILAVIIVRNICGYGELNIAALLDSRDEAKLTEALKKNYAQEQSPDSILEKFNLRRNCDYVLNEGSCTDKESFLKEYYALCQEESKQRTQAYAVFAAVSVVLSPKAAGDTLALLMWQCRIISTTIKIYGGRPSITKVLRIYVKVLTHAFMVGSIDEVLDQFAFGAMDVKMISFLTQALAAAATCLRTASLTRFYIYNGMDGDRKEALREAIREIPSGVVKVVKSDELKAAWKKFLDCSLTITKVVAEEGCKYTIDILTGKM